MGTTLPRRTGGLYTGLEWPTPSQNLDHLPTLQYAEAGQNKSGRVALCQHLFFIGLPQAGQPGSANVTPRCVTFSPRAGAGPLWAGRITMDGMQFFLGYGKLQDWANVSDVREPVYATLYTEIRPTQFVRVERDYVFFCSAARQ